MSDLLKRFVKEEDGATMVEYGIMVALIAAISIAAITILGQKVLAAFGKINAAMP